MRPSWYSAYIALAGFCFIYAAATDNIDAFWAGMVAWLWARINRLEDRLAD